MTGILPPIRYSTYVAAPPSALWTALTTGDGWDGWFTTSATIDARPGGSYTFHWEEFGGDRTTLSLSGPVLEADGERVFAFDWGSGDTTTTVRFTLEPRADGTLVEVTESGYSTSETDVLACLNCAAGWGEALTLLKFHLEHGVRYGPVPPP